MRGVFLLPGFLLGALCAWLLIPWGGPREGATAASAGATASAAHDGAPALAPLDVAAEPGARTAWVEGPSPEPAVARVSPPLLATLTGRILDGEQQPLRGARSARIASVDRLGRRRACDAGPEGGYALPALAPGPHWVQVSADGYRSLGALIELDPERTCVLDFTLQRALVLWVKVTDPEGRSLLEVLAEKGAPAAASRLLPVASRAPPGARFGEQGSDGSVVPGVGLFESRGPRAEGLPPGCIGVLLVDAELPVWVSLLHHRALLQTQRIDAGQDGVTFVLSPEDLLLGLASLRVRVLDAVTGLPLERARVALAGGASFDPGVTTDAQGCATLEGLPAGPFDLLVRAKRYAGISLPVETLAGGITDLGTLALEPEVTVAGRVLDADARPLAASFSLGRLDPSDRTVEWSSRAGFRSRGDGSFALRGLGRGEYVIRTRDRDAHVESDWKGSAPVSGNVVLDTRAGSLSGVEVRLCAASRLVLQGSERARDGTRFRVLDAGGLELGAGVLQGSEPRALALPPGQYRLALFGPAGTVAAERSVDLASTVLTLDLAR